MSAINLSNFTADLFRNSHLWTEYLMNGWVLVCVAGFVGFLIATDKRHRHRRELVTFNNSQLGAKQSKNGDRHKQEQDITDIPVPGSSSCGTVPSLEAKDDASHELELVHQGSQGSELSSSSPSEGVQRASPVGRVPKVLFKPIVEDVFDGKIDLGAIQQPLGSSSNQNSPQTTPETKRGFLPFVGRRYNRDVSNISLTSAGSKSGSSRSIASFILSPISSPRPRLEVDTSVQGPKHQRKSFTLPSPLGSPMLSGSSSRNSSPALLESHPRDSQLANEPFHIALARDECGICFTLLHKEPVAVCANDAGKPQCLHIYHDRCLKALRSRSCLFCKARFHYRRRIPEVDVDPKGWFETVDVDQSGGLTCREIARVLAAQLPIDRKALEALLYKHWARWDSDKNGEVDPDEFFANKRGLLAFLKKKRALFKIVEPELDPPDIRYDARGWFEYFDQDRSNSLSKSEVLRGLILSFSLSQSPLICLNLRKVLHAVWVLFDTDKSGTISKREFLEPKTGLATSLTLSLNLSEKGRLY